MAASDITASDISGLEAEMRKFLEALPGRLTEKHAFFRDRFHLTLRKTNYTVLWEDLGVPGHLPRAKYVLEYALAHLTAPVVALLRRAAGDAVVPRRAADPPLADLLFFQNGKIRRLGRIVRDALPAVASVRRAASVPVKPQPSGSSSAPTARPEPGRRAPAAAPDNTTVTGDGHSHGWWREQERYESLERIGKGGMAFVYRVKDKRRGTVRAAKVIDPKHRKDVEYQARFSREVRAQSALVHPHIHRVLDVGRDFYVAELCEASLSDLIRRGELTRSRALALFREACLGVEYAHAQRVVHRDLKPSNLLIRKGGRLVVADFGLCRIDTSEFTTVTSTRVQGGTLRYAAPEQWANLHRADHRADVYSLGVILMDLLVGNTLASVGDEQTLTRAKADPFISIVSRATAFRPEDRYPSVEELRTAVAAAGSTSRSVPSRRRQR